MLLLNTVWYFSLQQEGYPGTHAAVADLPLNRALYLGGTIYSHVAVNWMTLTYIIDCGAGMSLAAYISGLSVVDAVCTC